MPKLNHNLQAGSSKKTVVLAEFPIKNDPKLISSLKKDWDEMGLSYDTKKQPCKINDNRYLTLRFVGFGGMEIPLARFDNSIEPDSQVSLNDIIERGILTYTCQIKNLKALHYWNQKSFKLTSEFYEDSQSCEFLFNPEDIAGSPKSEDQIKEWLRFPEVL